VTLAATDTRPAVQGLWPRLSIAAFFAVLCIILLTTQNSKQGFERGHHGWVSSHVLAIATHAYPGNGFVGYAVQSRDSAGKNQYQYFDRYPVFFSAALHGLMQASPDVSMQIYLSRQFMNLVFFLNIVAAYFLLMRLTGSPLISLSAVLLAFSGYYFMYFKDMVHFDQPAVLGITLLLYGVVVYRQTHKIWPLYIAAIAALSMGRAYPSMAVISLWLLLECIHILRGHSWRLAPAAATLASSQVPRLFLVGLLLSSSYLAYNLSMEATIRDVSVTETSIVDSAQRRLGIDTAFTQERTVPLTWSAHAERQVERLVVGAIPYPFGVADEYKRAVEYLVRRAGLPAAVLALALGAAVLARFIARQSPATRRLWLLVACSGFAWIVPMKNLALPHHYTTIYHLGFYLALFTALVSLVPRRGHPYVLALAAAVFFSANLSVNSVHDSVASRVNPVTEDFARIRQNLEPDANIFVFVPGGFQMDGSVAIVDGAPYAVGFYLPEQYLTSIGQADYVLSRDRAQHCPVGVACELVTLGNEHVFLSRIRNAR
jgi:hypothetical protein